MQIMTNVQRVSFWRIFWPSLIAILVASFISMLLFFMFLGATLSSFSSEFEHKKFKVKDNSILHVKFDKPITDKTSFSFNPIEMNIDGSVGLADLLIGLEKASKDNKIKGMYIDLDNLTCGYATLFELRKAIETFKTSGKFVVAYHSGEAISQKEYLLASVADENYGFPSSMMEFLGLGVEMMYYKNLFSKLSIEMQVIRGENNDFKSAVEPYFLDKMSDSSRLQTQELLKGIWSEYLNAVSLSRSIDIETLNALADNVSITRVKDAVQHNLIDSALYQDEVLTILRKKTNTPLSEDLNLVSFTTYAQKKAREQKILDDAKTANIAIILAEGAIDRNGDGISSTSLVKQIREVRENKDIKAVVLRVNSPGGSALASDEIWREVMLTNQIKPVIVSMGNVAASGGYYISAAAQYIFAEPTTITGSIGVFGMIPYTGKMLEDKVGLSFDRFGTNKHSVNSLNKKLSDEEYALIQHEVNLIYTEFIQVVSDGRKLTPEQVNTIARGRVWTGTDALKIGLVDEIGGLSDAIQYALKTAEIKAPIYSYYPKSRDDKWMQLLENIMSEENESELKIQSSFTSEASKILNSLKELDGIRGIQMRLPYHLEIN
jgi:protease IV